MLGVDKVNYSQYGYGDRMGPTMVDDFSKSKKEPKIRFEYQERPMYNPNAYDRPMPPPQAQDTPIENKPNTDVPIINPPDKITKKQAAIELYNSTIEKKNICAVAMVGSLIIAGLGNISYLYADISGILVCLYMGYHFNKSLQFSNYLGNKYL